MFEYFTFPLHLGAIFIYDIVTLPRGVILYYGTYPVYLGVMFEYGMFSLCHVSLW